MLTSIYAAFIGFLLIFLSIHTVKGRRNCCAGLGDAGDVDMQRRIRAQGNLAEYAPIFLILLGYAEYENLPAWAIHGIGIIFVSGRIMHAYSLLKAEKYDGYKLVANPIWRIRGMKCTFNCIGLLSAVVTVQYFV